MNIFKAVKAKTVSEYLKAVPKDRRETIIFLHKFIQKCAPKLKPHFAYNMLGYGSFPYKNYKKEMIEWPVISLANQKNYVSVYVCAVIDGKYVAEIHAKELGKPRTIRDKSRQVQGRVSVGKSCIRFKKLEDVNLPVLKKVIGLAAKNPGLTGMNRQQKNNVL